MLRKAFSGIGESHSYLQSGQQALTGVSVCTGPHVPEGAELFYVKLHSTLTMSCSFGPEFASTRKYLCKMGKSGCYNIIDTYGKVDEDFVGRVLLSNEDTPGSFSIVITQMGWEDSGLYLCGAGVYGESGETKELDVHVYEGEQTIPSGSLPSSLLLFRSITSSLALTRTLISLHRVLLSYPLL